MDEPAAPAAQPPSAIGTLCDHAGEVWSFFAQVLGQRPIVGDERARYELQAQLRMLLRGSYSWRSETALEFCTRSAVKASEAFEQAGAPFDAADFATALWNEFQQERKTILERVESLYAPAVHQCHVHGDLTQTAHDAVRQLVDLLRDLWGVVEWDDWSKRSSGVSNAIHEARVWAVPPVETVKASAAPPDRGDAKGVMHHSAAPAARGSRNTRKIDVDYRLGKLEAKVRKDLRESGTPEAAMAVALADCLFSLSAADLAVKLKDAGYPAGAKTISRSRKYKSWRIHRRRAAPAGAAADPTARPGRNRTPSDADAKLADTLNTGGTTLRKSGRDAARIRKTSADRTADEAADRFAREKGVALPLVE
jgi:hypothetical protein